MYRFLHQLLSDKKGGEIFTLFGLWHFLYLMLTLFVIVAALRAGKKKSAAEREKLSGTFINMAFFLYILDFFLMPLAYNEIDIEKLPFHACTAMCVMCFLCRHVPCFGKYHTSFAMLGFVSNLVYLIYPAGVMWHGVHPLSYRVIQTLLFHCVMTVYGFLVLVYQPGRPGLQTICRDLTVIVSMTLWAVFGNLVYNGTTEGYSHFFNWFFVVRDPFYFIPEAIASFIMPLLNVVLFFLTETLLRLMLWSYSIKIKAH